MNCVNQCDLCLILIEVLQTFKKRNMMTRQNCVDHQNNVVLATQRVLNHLYENMSGS